MTEYIAFRMNLKPGAIAEYRRRHDEIWPELTAAMRTAGVLDYAIWQDSETNNLFATMTVTDRDKLSTMRESEVVRRWWAFMSDMMEYNDDGTPLSIPLEEVFRLN